MATSLPKSLQWKFGKLGLIFYDVDVTHNATVAGTLGVTGVATFTVAPVFTAQPLKSAQTIAATGTNLATAAQLIAGLNIVTATDGTVGVKLPATPTIGTEVVVIGVTSGNLKVYPDAAATINAISSNASITLGTLVRCTFYAASATQWYTVPLVPS